MYCGCSYWRGAAYPSLLADHGNQGHQSHHHHHPHLVQEAFNWVGQGGSSSNHMTISSHFTINNPHHPQCFWERVSRYVSVCDCTQNFKPYWYFFWYKIFLILILYSGTNIVETDTSTKYFLYQFQDFFRYQICPIPVPRLFRYQLFCDTTKKMKSPGTGTSHSNMYSIGKKGLFRPITISGLIMQFMAKFWPYFFYRKGWDDV